MQGRDKLWLPLAGRIILARTIDAFEASPLIDRIALVVNAARVDDATALCQNEAWRKIAAVVPGGERRQDSVRLGLDALAQVAPAWVMIHDGARPFVTQECIAAGLQAASQHGAAIAAVPVKDTIKIVRAGSVHATLDRAELWAVQTPQVFSFPLIHQAHHRPEALADVTDDAALLELLGHPVVVFPGAYTNIKITTEDDLLLAQTFIEQGLYS
jgi:2-C-methyl-D-erythritol 4-phosphate cytidylyltransferase